MHHWIGNQWSSQSVSNKDRCNGFCVTTLGSTSEVNRLTRLTVNRHIFDHYMNEVHAGHLILLHSLRTDSTNAAASDVSHTRDLLCPSNGCHKLAISKLWKCHHCLVGTICKRCIWTGVDCLRLKAQQLLQDLLTAYRIKYITVLRCPIKNRLWFGK